MGSPQQFILGSEMKWTLSLLFVASVAKALPYREGKAFSLFSVVSFPNEECFTTMNPPMVGQCVTAEECTGSEGSASGNCASGFGVCCFRIVEATEDTQTVPVNNDHTHIQNDGYPTPVGAIANKPAGDLTFQISGDASICRIRLDFIDAVFTQPIGVAGQNDGVCGGATGDSLTVMVPGGLNPGFTSLCGTLTGQHIYLPTSGANPGLEVNIATGTNNFARRWKILVRRLRCNDPDLPQSHDCLQYFTGLTGQITSLNGGFDGQMMLRNLDYNICIRPGANMCALTLIEAGGDIDSFSLQSDNAGANTGAGNSVTGRDAGTAATKCAVEGILIPNAVGAGLELMFGTPTNAFPPLFCGGNLNNVDAQATSSPVLALDLIGGNTFEIGVMADNQGSAANTGFNLIYRQSTC